MKEHQGDSRYAMLFVKRGNKKVFASTKTFIPDVDSLTMKIKRANLVAHSWINCLNSEYEGLTHCCMDGISIMML